MTSDGDGLRKHGGVNGGIDRDNGTTNTASSVWCFYRVRGDLRRVRPSVRQLGFRARYCTQKDSVQYCSSFYQVEWQRHRCCAVKAVASNTEAENRTFWLVVWAKITVENIILPKLHYIHPTENFQNFKFSKKKINFFFFVLSLKHSKPSIFKDWTWTALSIWMKYR